MKNFRLSYLFQKYLDQACTPDEYQELMEYINNNSHDAQLRELIDSAANQLPNERMSAVKAREILNSIIAVNPVQPAHKKVFRLNYGMVGFAASILLIAALGFLFISKPKPSVNEVKLTWSKPVNDHRMVKLSDGSTVTLNKFSQIKYPAEFNGRTREVTLIGEGYFDIKHDTRRPFLVHIGNLTVTVLGTAFNINAAAKNISVTVTRGRVSVSDSHRVLATLTPNQQIKVSTADLKARQLVVNASQVIKWQADDIYFDDVTMDQAMKLLETRFNTRIIFNNEHIKHCTLTGTFTHNESLQQVLKVICSFNNAKYEMKPGQPVVISGAGC